MSMHRDRAFRAQPSLFDAERTVAPETRAQAFRVSKPKHTSRVLAAMDCLRRAGSRGLTRHELAEAMGLPLQSVCSIALELRRSGLAREVGKRKTPSGSHAAVLVLADFGGRLDDR